MAGIAQAELAFVPEVREIRARPIPKAPPAVLPDRLAVSLGRDLVGVVGRF